LERRGGINTMEETLMMDDEELAEHIEQIRDEVEQADERSPERQERLETAIEEAESRGYPTLEDLKESL